MSNAAKQIEPPNSSKFDVVEKVVRAAASLHPASAAIAELISPLAERRNQKWMQEMSDVVNSLVQRNYISVEDLRNSEEFVSLVFETTRIAIKNHQQEKLTALKNAFNNSLLNTQPDETLRSVFFNFVDRYTEFHIRFLRVLADKEQVIKELNLDFQKFTQARYAELFGTIFPKLSGNAVSSVWRDLFTDGLVDGESPGTQIPVVKSWTPELTQLGQFFLKFISGPDSRGDER